MLSQRRKARKGFMFFRRSDFSREQPNHVISTERRNPLQVGRSLPSVETTKSIRG